MGTVIDLYVIPKHGTPLATVAPLVERLLREGFLQGPCTLGPPTTSYEYLDGPQSMSSDAQKPIAIAGLAMELATDAPRVVVLPAMNPAHPDNQRDFYFCNGVECAIGFYVFPAGSRLTITHAESPFDETVRVWAQFEGKLAPWTDVFERSVLGSVFREAWPGFRLVETGDA